MRVIGIVLTATLVAAAQGEVFDFAGVIDGDQAGSGSPAVGSITGQYDDVANTFSFSWNISDDLIGVPSSPGSHIHNAPAGSNGPIVFAFNNPDGTWALSGDATWSGLSSDHVEALFAGALYANFHTSAFPGGEVRGQILAVPAPAGFALLGFGGFALVRRRR